MTSVTHTCFDLEQRHAASKTQSRLRIYRTSLRCCWVSTSIQHTLIRIPGECHIFVFQLNKVCEVFHLNGSVQTLRPLYFFLLYKVWKTVTSATEPPLRELREDRASVLSQDYWQYSHGKAALWHVQKLNQYLHKLLECTVRHWGIYWVFMYNCIGHVRYRFSLRKYIGDLLCCICLESICLILVIKRFLFNLQFFQLTVW